MSYILDALKKIELEKNKKNQPDGRVNISGDLFLERKQPVAKTGIWKIVVMVAVASLVTCAVTWLLLRGNGNQGAVIIRPSAPQPAPVNPPAATPPVPLPVQPRSLPVAVPPVVPSAVAPVQPKRTEAAGDDDSAPRKARRSKREAKAQPLSQKQPVQTVQAPADIKLSGIAWQDERTGRRAVINGYLLKEGAVVSGAKITDIRADRVRFSSPAGQFEIKLDAVLPAEVIK